jgi:hypothetical protein
MCISIAKDTHPNIFDGWFECVACSTRRFPEWSAAKFNIFLFLHLAMVFNSRWLRLG